MLKIDIKKNLKKFYYVNTFLWELNDILFLITSYFRLKNDSQKIGYNSMFYKWLGHNIHLFVGIYVCTYQNESQCKVNNNKKELHNYILKDFFKTLNYE